MSGVYTGPPNPETEPELRLWLLSQDYNRSYDTFDSAIVRAYTEDEALNLMEGYIPYRETWAPREMVQIEEVGVATPGSKPGVVCASFNAG